MHDKLFANQQALDPASMEKYAGEIGASVPKWKSCMESGKHRDAIKKQQEEVNKMGARGTPAFWINGRFLSGAQPYPAFKAVVDDELKKAKDVTSKGIAKSDYYQKQVVEKGAKQLN
jgi:protein-disulfide isomerase